MYIVSVNSTKFNSIEKVHNYILFIKTEDECNITLGMLTRTSSWNAHAKFFIFVDYLERNWSEFVSFILAEFWREHVIDIIVNIAVNETISHTKVIDANKAEHGTHIDVYICSHFVMTKLDTDMDAVRCGQLW